MTEFHRDHLMPPQSTEVPKELAILIARKAIAMAEKFECQAVDQMARDARRALERGNPPEFIIRQMGL